MDVVITHANAWLDANVYQSATPTPLASLWSAIPLFFVMTIGAVLLYFSVATLDYVFFWQGENESDPKWTWSAKGANKAPPGQIKKEIKHAMSSVPTMAVLTVPIYLAEFYGYSKVYYDINDYPVWFTLGSIVWFFMFTDFGIYWIHRFLHHRSLYWIHAPHHAYIAPTPYASIAFHPLDGWAQALPYHTYVFLFPFNNWVYLSLFVGVQIWTISIHDRVSFGDNGWLNGCAHHMLHHSRSRVNYGQYFTLWDRIGGSYMPPNPEIYKKKGAKSS